MYELGVRRRFSAAHQLRGHQGQCETLHGHTYQVEARFRAEGLDAIGLAADFHELKRLMDEIISPLDHSFLNERPPFDQINPSAENLARVIYERLQPTLPAAVTLTAVKVWESEEAWASWEESR